MAIFKFVLLCGGISNDNGSSVFPTAEPRSAVNARRPSFDGNPSWGPPTHGPWRCIRRRRPSAEFLDLASVVVPITANPALHRNRKSGFHYSCAPSGTLFVLIRLRNTIRSDRSVLVGM